MKTKLKHVKSKIVSHKHFTKLRVALVETGKFIRRYKYYFIVGGVLLLGAFMFWLSTTWLVKSSLSSTQTFPKTSVFDVKLGNLSDADLNKQLLALKKNFETKQVTLTFNSSKWTYKLGDLGVNFDADKTAQSIKKLNTLSFLGKLKLSVGLTSSAIEPTITSDYEKCLSATANIPKVQVEVKDAYVYYEGSIKIAVEQTGAEFDAKATCKSLTSHLASNQLSYNISVNNVSAALSKTELETKLPLIETMAGNTLTLKSGSYNKELSTEQLLSMLSITKSGSDVKVEWSSKVDELIDSIASSVNTYNATPSLGACQYVISNGGNRLDSAATKNIFNGLATNTNRVYNLSVGYRDTAIGTRSTLPQGGSGTIYLTYDDGMTYANNIMNYAACYGIKVTFFEIGERVGTDAAQLVRAINEGHAVQSHGYYHAMYDYGARSYEWQYNDMAQSINVLTAVTGKRPTYFRPPGGNRSADTYTAAAANGLNLILWGVSSQDATPGGLSSSQICSNVVSRAFNGASVLMHSTKYSTAEALPCIAEGLSRRGFNMYALW